MFDHGMVWSTHYQDEVGGKQWNLKAGSHVMLHVHCCQQSAASQLMLAANNFHLC
jgi:hypothetical protein